MVGGIGVLLYIGAVAGIGEYRHKPQNLQVLRLRHTPAFASKGIYHNVPFRPRWPLPYTLRKRGLFVSSGKRL